MPHAFQKLGRYRLTEKIASGGMASVYRATLVGAAGFEKQFAVKRILPQWSHDHEFARLLAQEAKILTTLEHPNIVQVFELGEECGSLYLVMEFIDGWDLKRVLNGLREHGKTLPPPIAGFITKEICRALAFADHIVHRDVSPHNILIDKNGRVKLADFGIAKIAGKSHVTHTTALKGKFSYMSPEQARGEALDARSDLFSLGAVLSEMISGKKCFDGANDIEILNKVREVQMLLPENVPPPFRDVIALCLKKNRNERPQSAASIRQLIETCEKKYGWNAQENDLALFLRENAPHDAPFQNRKYATIINPTTRVHERTIGESVSKPNLNTVVTPVPFPIPSRPSHPFWYRAVRFATICCLPLCIAAPATVTKPENKEDSRIAIFSKQCAIQTGRQVKHLNQRMSHPPTHRHQAATQKAVSCQQQSSKETPYTNRYYPMANGCAANDPAPTPEKNPTGLGTIIVDARPWGTAAIRGYGKKDTPARFRVREGILAVTASYPPRHESLTTSVTINAGETLTCRAGFAHRKSLSCSRGR